MTATSSQALALRLALAGPLRYFRGGYYSIPGAGEDQRDPANAAAEYVTRQTIDACVRYGWLLWSKPSPDVYGQRWTITDVGRTVAAGVAVGERTGA